MSKESLLYEKGFTCKQVAMIVGMSQTGIWKRLKKQGVKTRKSGLKKGNCWGIKKRGVSFLGADGRYWIRGIKTSKNRNSRRRAIVIMERIIGKPIPKGYVVHHKDENKTNDDPKNLELVINKKHIPSFHKRRRQNTNG